MRAMVLTGIRQMEMRNVPKPKIVKPNDVLIKMSAVGICGSDVHYYTTGRIGSQVVRYPFTVGHEGAGIVEAVGKGVTKFLPGSRVAIDPAISCYKCDQCRAGRHHTCRELLFLGCPGQISGCLSEYIIMPEDSLFHIKDSMTMQQAAISEPLAIGVYAVKKSIPMQNKTVGILGCGPIGMSVYLPARAQGAGNIYVTEKIPERIEIAKKAGANWIGNPITDNIVQEIMNLEPGGLDVVFECCGQQEALDQAIDLLAPGGKLMLVGIPSKSRIDFSIDSLRRKEICIQNVRRQVDCVQDSLNMIDNKIFDVDFMATHHFKFEESKNGFDIVANYKDGVMKAIIDFD